MWSAIWVKQSTKAGASSLETASKASRARGMIGAALASMAVRTMKNHDSSSVPVNVNCAARLSGSEMGFDAS